MSIGGRGPGPPGYALVSKILYINNKFSKISKPY